MSPSHFRNGAQLRGSREQISVDLVASQCTRTHHDIWAEGWEVEKNEIRRGRVLQVRYDR